MAKRRRSQTAAGPAFPRKVPFRAAASKGRGASGRLRGLRFWLWRRILPFLAIIVFSFYGLVILSLIALRVIDPITTSVQIQRRIESWASHDRYHKQFEFVSLTNISPYLQHAVLTAEDARFYRHNGFDWKEIEQAVNNDADGKRLRGASTITQQLVKNLYLTTSRSLFRKGVEASIVPMMEAILSKQRILELYLNVIEWGPGVYGAEAAARYHFHASAAALNRDQAARLAAIIPAPLRRRPGQMSQSAERIELRMRQSGF